MKTILKNQPFSRLPKLVCGGLVCIWILPGLAFSQGNEFESNFSTQKVDWSASGSWTRISGEGDVPTSLADSIRIIDIDARHDIIVDVDGLHINLLEYTAESSGQTTGPQYIFANGTRTLKIDTLTKKGSYTTTVANGKIDGVEQSLSMEIGDLNIEAGSFHIGFGTSTSSIGGLEAFSVTGKTTIANGSILVYRGVKNRVEGENRIQLGHFELLGNGRFVLGGDGNSTGIVEVASLSGNGIVRVSDVGIHKGTAGTLQINSQNESPETFSGTLQDYTLDSNPATLTLLKTGAGTQIFSGNNNVYTGATTINEGVLAVVNTSGSGLGSGPVEVGGTGILAGSGSIAPGKRLEEGGEVGNTITVHNGGSVAPSAHLTAAVTTLTLNGANNLGATILHMEEGSSFTFRLGEDNASDSIHFSGYHAGGLQFFAGGVDVNVLDAQIGLFDLFTFNSITGSELNQLADLLNAGSGFGGSYQATFLGNGNTISLQVDAIPEPGETTLLLMGIAGMACWRIYRKGRQTSSAGMA